MMAIVRSQNPRSQKVTNNLPARRRNNQTGLYAKGARSRKLRDAQTRYYLNRLLRTAPWIERQDRMLLRQYVRLELLAYRVYSALRDDEKIVTGKGETKRLVQDFRRLVLAQASIGAQLGLSPSSRAGLRSELSNPRTIDVTDAQVEQAIEVGRGESPREKRAPSDERA